MSRYVVSSPTNFLELSYRSPSSININFPFLRYDRGEEAQVHRFVARIARNANTRVPFIPLQIAPRDVERLRFLSSVSTLYGRALRDPRWRNVSKAWRGCESSSEPVAATKVSDQFFVTRGIISRFVRRISPLLRFDSYARRRIVAGPSLLLANRFSRISMYGSMGIL